MRRLGYNSTYQDADRLILTQLNKRFKGYLIRKRCESSRLNGGGAVNFNSEMFSEGQHLITEYTPLLEKIKD